MSVAPTGPPTLPEPLTRAMRTTLSVPVGGCCLASYSVPHCNTRWYDIRMARTPDTDQARTVVVNVRLTPKAAAAMDYYRDRLSRSDYLRRLIRMDILDKQEHGWKPTPKLPGDIEF